MTGAGINDLDVTSLGRGNLSMDGASVVDFGMDDTSVIINGKVDIVIREK